jgi:hypothetical protein
VTVVIQMPSDAYHQLERHLIRGVNANEEAAFVFAHFDERTGALTLVDLYLVPPKGFVVQLPYHFELSDETRAYVIKRAHDLSTSLIEIHSHTGLGKPRFSPSEASKSM